MQARWRKALESFQRVQVFLGAHPAQGSASYAAAESARRGVEPRRRTLDGAGNWLATEPGIERRQDVLMQTLRTHHLRPIAAIARVTFTQSPGIEKVLQMPPSALGPLGLLAAAKSIRRSVGLYQPVFIRNGRPADFLVQLDAAIAVLDESAAGRVRNVGRHVDARAGIRKELRRGRRAVDMVDTIVRVAFEGQDDVLAEWDVAKRVQSLPTSSPSVAEEDPVIVPEAKLSAA